MCMALPFHLTQLIEAIAVETERIIIVFRIPENKPLWHAKVCPCWKCSSTRDFDWGTQLVMESHYDRISSYISSRIGFTRAGLIASNSFAGPLHEAVGLFHGSQCS